MFVFPIRRLDKFKWILTTVLIVVSTAAGNPSSAIAQDRHWSGPVDGGWNDASKWTGSEIPDIIGETANINTGGTYEVTYNSNYSIGGLTLGATGASLTMYGIGGDTSLELASDLFVFGTINLDSNQDGRDTTLICNGTITNEASGNINFGGISVNGASDRNLRADNFINFGNVNVYQNGRFDKTNGVFTNNNIVNVATGKSFNFGTNNTFNQNAGTFDNQGSVSMTGGTVNLNGGDFTGNAFNLRDSTLNLSGTGSGVFNLTGNTTFSGNVVNGQQLNLNAIFGVNQVTTVTADFNNFGVINLDSNQNGIDVSMTRAGLIGNSLGGTINFGGTSLNNATDRRLQADQFVNDGVVNINRFANFDQTNGVYTNNNEINIATGSRLQFGTNNTFNQNGGTFDNQGNLTFNGDTLNFNGGNFTGNAISLRDSTLNNNTTGTGVFYLTGTVDYTGDLVSGQILNLSAEGNNTQTTTLGDDFTNFSTINIDSNQAGIDVAMIRAGSINNDATGTINFGGTSLNNATDRRLQADQFVNDGVVNINRFANFDQTNGVYTNNNEINIAAGSRLQFGTNNTFNQNGGTFDNQGNLTFNADTLNFNGGNFMGNEILMSGSTLNIGIGSVGSGDFVLTGINTLSGDLSSNQSINVLVNSSTTATTTATGDFVNHGLIALNSNTNGVDVSLIRDGRITNSAAGIITFGGTSINGATDRILDAELHNAGLVEILSANQNSRIGSDSITQVMSHLNTGTILNRDSTLTVLGESFINESGGILTGDGVFDFIDTGMTNEGIIAAGLSAGHMEIRGLIELSATSDLQFELGGTLPTEFDRISFANNLLLDGGLSVSFIDNFQDSILSTDSFTIVDSSSTSGMFAGLADGTRLATTDGFGTFQINYVGNDIVLGNFLSVPEPGGILPVLGLILAFLSVRRRNDLATSC